MEKLSRDMLYSLEEYAGLRADFREQVMEHKKNRQVEIGPHARLYFEDFLTLHYQVQEMLRVERIFEADGIEDELATYNPLIPDGSNWKATFMLEYEDVAVRQKALAGLVGVEDKIWMQVGEQERVFSIADEDLPRSTEEKTSAVHFLRFELPPTAAAAAKAGAPITAGIDHAAYRMSVTLIDPIRQSLLADLD